MNASGGVPAKTSAGTGFSTRAENVSAAAIRSRWKCMAALGRPVVPEVKAIIATSSAAVWTVAKSAGLAAAAAVRSAGPGAPTVTTRRPGTAAAVSSPVRRWSHSARRT